MYEYEYLYLLYTYSLTQLAAEVAGSVRESIYIRLFEPAGVGAHCPAFTGKHNFFPQVPSDHKKKKKKKRVKRKKQFAKPSHFIISFPSSREKGKT
jgi:hypothetical protein